MTAICHPVADSVAQDMIRGVVRAVCDRPGQTTVQREARAREVVGSMMAFRPRDPLEIMLAGLAVTNFHLIMDRTHDAFNEATEPPRGRANSGIVGLERAMTGLLKEIRIAQSRPWEVAEEATARDEPPEPSATPAPKTEAKPTPVSPAPNRAAPPSWEDAAPVPLLPPARQSETSATAIQAAMMPAGKPAGVNAQSQRVTAARMSEDVVRDALENLVVKASGARAEDTG